MPTVKDFEDQKTELLGLLWSISAYVPDDTVEEIGERIEKLQPPRPTCSTCTHWIDEELKVTKDSVFPHKTCDNLKMWENLKIGSDKKAKLVFINPTKDFGCTFHSDFEVKDE